VGNICDVSVEASRNGVVRWVI